MTLTHDQVGRLVRWTVAPGSPYGHISAINGNVVTVELDGVGVRQFSRTAFPCEPVELKGRVRRVSTGELGVLIGPAAVSMRWKVLFPSGERTVHESDLRPRPAVDPIERLANKEVGSAEQFNLRTVTRHYELEHLHNELVSLDASRVDLMPHQVAVVHRVVSNYPHRFLLCDEVGLGKTIEAGMIIKELRARGHAARALVIVPPNLVRQWQFELRSKFNEAFAILNTDTIRYLRNQGFTGNPFGHYDSVIVSSWWITEATRAQQVAQVNWDLIAVDEAHHARRRRYGGKTETTRLYRLVRDLVAPVNFLKRAVLLLTATPMQLERQELFSLVEMLDPALFVSEEQFERHIAALPGLSGLVESLHDAAEHGHKPTEDDRRRAVEWLGWDLDLVEKTVETGPDGVLRLADELARQHLLSEVLIRNRKVRVGGFMPRHAFRWEVTLTQSEATALDAVESYVLTGYNLAASNRDNSLGFVMTTFQRLMASSIAALRASLAKRLHSLDGFGVGSSSAEEALEEDAPAVDAVTRGRAMKGERERLGQLIALLDKVERDSKADVLLDQLDVIREQDANAKVLIFTQFRETQDYLMERLTSRGWSVNVFHGQMKAEGKDAAVERFRDDEGPQVLVSTEAGGEGRNFQFCHLLVNYDLPWNPMRVEQRIGRVDRIGQDNVVQIFNMWVRGTIEERILDVLERRINVFELTVGGLDPILGETERDLRRILRQAGVERERALEQFEQDVERRVVRARRAEQQLRDFVMDTKSFSREISERVLGQASPVSEEDREHLLKRLLASVRTYIHEFRDGEYEVVFHEPFVSDHPELIKDGRRRLAVFRSSRHRDSEHVEFFAFGHPIVDALREQVTDNEYAGNASAFSLAVVDHESSAGSGWLFNFEVAVPGIRTVGRMLPVFVGDDGSVSGEEGQRLLERSTRFPGDHALDDFETETLEQAAQVAEAHVESELHRLEEEVRRESEAGSAREERKLEDYFAYRQRAAADRIEATERILARIEGSMDQEERRILPVWKANLDRERSLLDELQAEKTRRLAELKGRLRPSGDYRLVSAARIGQIEEDTQVRSGRE